jgi:hypothetical protein
MRDDDRDREVKAALARVTGTRNNIATIMNEKEDEEGWRHK